MKKIILLIVLAITSLWTIAQNPCNENKPWGMWIQLHPGDATCTAPCGTAIQFKNGNCQSNGSVCGWGLQWRWYIYKLIK